MYPLVLTVVTHSPLLLALHGDMCTVCGQYSVLCLWELQVHMYCLWGRSMTCTLFLIVLLEFQYYEEKLFSQMYNPGGMPLQEELF